MALFGLGKKESIETHQEKIEKHQEKETAIMGAINDVSSELEKLKKQRELFESKAKKIGAKITSTQIEESRLRGQISTLIEKEGILEKKRARLKEKLEAVKSRIAKISKIKEELSEIE